MWPYRSIVIAAVACPSTRLLIVDWAPHVDEGDKILYILDCGDLGGDQKRIQLASDELGRWEWVTVGRLPDYVISPAVLLVLRPDGEIEEVLNGRDDLAQRGS